TARYCSGAMPGSYAFTGQRADSMAGLDYYNARYYDPVAGQFISADTAEEGLNRYTYVLDDPERWTDPSGHRLTCSPDYVADCSGTSDAGRQQPRWRSYGC